MSENTWLPITYRDFYDIPHLIAVPYKGTLYLLDSPFDDDKDDYSDHFQVYRLPMELCEQLKALSWINLSQRGEEVGEIPVSHVKFDQSRRHFIQSDAFHELDITGRL